MKTIGGWGGGSVARIRSKQRGTLGALGLSLAFVVSVFVMQGEASAGVYGGGWNPVPPTGGQSTAGGEEEPPPKSPKEFQECFDNFLRNQARCKDLWCEPSSILGLYSWTSCKNRFLNSCIQAAETVFYCCMYPGPSCGEG